MIIPFLIILLATLLALFLENRIIRGASRRGDSAETTREVLRVYQIIPFMIILLTIQSVLEGRVEMTFKWHALTIIITMAYIYGVIEIFRRCVKPREDD